MTAPLPANEIERLAKLAADGILDTVSERVSGDLTRLAAQACDAQSLGESRRMLSDLMGNVPGMAYRCRNDADWTLEFVSQGCLELTGYGPEELTQGPTARFVNLIDPEYRGQQWDVIQEALRQRSRFRLAYPLLTRTGERKWVWEQGCGVFGPDGALRYLEGFVMDITERRQAEDALRERERLLQSVTDHVPVLIARVDTQRRYVFVNRAYEDRLHLPRNQVLGRTIAEVLGDAADKIVRPYMDRVLAGETVVYEAQVDLPAIGSRFVHVTYVPERGADGVVNGFVLSALDITDRKALEAEREVLLAETKRLLAEAIDRADRDPLTGLLNHRAFHARLEQEADRAQREGASLAVVMLDLNNFKFFNDAYGHLAGDEVLRRVAQALQGLCRSYDTPARFGGDEFALLMPGVSAADAEQHTQRLVDGLEGLDYCPPGHDTPIPLSLSAGVAVFPDEAAGRLEAVDLADARLRLAKTGGDDAVVAAEKVRRETALKIGEFSMLDALVTAVDNKDRYTRRHSEDVLTYSGMIAAALGLDDEMRYIVAVAALLHDVGKIGVPDAILRKPGPLTPAEFDAMRQHPQMGAALVAAVPGFEETLDAVRHHHERWDGGGYPSGLRGEAIPLTARLLAVADAFSAMTTDRPYRKGLPTEQAMAILRDGAGSQWDPVCVRAFLVGKALAQEGK